MYDGSSGPQNITDPAGDKCQVIADVTSPTGCTDLGSDGEGGPPPYCVGLGGHWQIFTCSNYTDPSGSLTITPVSPWAYDVSVLAIGGSFSRISAIITDTSDIKNGNVTVNLSAPSGTTGDLMLDFNGSDASGPELAQAPFPALSPGTQTLQLTFDSIDPGIYPMANGTWDANVPGASGVQSVTVPDYTLPTPWTYFRKIFYTQYNVPHESACSGGDADAWLVDTSCNFTKIRLNSAFITAVWTNGTGISEHYGTLKNAAGVKLGSGNGQKCQNKYPSGAIGSTPKLPNGKNGNGNTFEVVSSITGSCNTTLVADQSLAAPSSILSSVQVLSCGDQLNLDDGDYTTASTRTVSDLCPYCSNTSPFNNPTSPMYGADGHIDAFSSNPSCTGKSVGSLGFFYTSYPTN